MKAGPELDELIRTHIFGYDKNFKGSQTIPGLLDVYDNEINMLDFEPSSPRKIDHAWAVVKKMQKKHFMYIETGVGNYTVRIRDHMSFPEHKDRAFSQEKTAPHAICLAALKAKGIEV